MSEDSIEKVMVEAGARGLSHANLGFFESSGSYRSKRYSVRHLKKAMTEGVGGSACRPGCTPAATSSRPISSSIPNGVIRTGSGVFFDPDGEHRLSDTARNFLGGLVRYLPELFLLLAPHLNSYKRFAPGLFTPLNNSWGINNKTVALRVVNASPASTRIEVRPAGADVCAHLALLAVCLAGRLGIEQKIVAPPPVAGNGWDGLGAGYVRKLVMGNAHDR